VLSREYFFEEKNKMSNIIIKPFCEKNTNFELENFFNDKNSDQIKNKLENPTKKIFLERESYKTQVEDFISRNLEAQKDKTEFYSPAKQFFSFGDIHGGFKKIK
jgi:Fe-S oxidoreductase